MLRINANNLSKVYPKAAAGGKDLLALDNVSFSIEPGEMFFLLGPSGCGKTTLLRILAGFIEPTAGTIHFDDDDVTHLSPEKRHLAMVFQSYALWPHMTVQRNVEFGPRTAGWSRDKRHRIVREMLDLVGMADRRHAKPPQLSGGQQQRVALARALAVSPRGLLFDEPLSNLDARLRARMRDEIRRLVKSTAATAVYVTHDQEEALSMADRIAVMHSGRIVQVGPPRDIYRRPATKFVADFLGEANFLSGRVIDRADGMLRVQTPSGQIHAVCDSDPVVGASVLCCVRPESLRLAGDRAERNSLTARCRDLTYYGQTTRYNLVLTSGEPLAAVSLEGQPVATVGQQVQVHFHPEDAVVLAE